MAVTTFILHIRKKAMKVKYVNCEIKYSFGSSIKFSADTFEMVLKKGKRKELIKVSQFSLSIPLTRQRYSLSVSRALKASLRILCS